jgi:hypothetical protein
MAPVKKPKVSKRTIEFELGSVDPSRLAAKVAQSGGENGIFPMADGSGVTFGRRPDPGEINGEGLPDLKTDRGLFIERNINFVVRVTCDREGVTYLEIAQEGHQSFYRFPFTGIEYPDAVQATVEFDQWLSRFLILYGMFPLFRGFYRSRESNKKKRSEAFDKITANFQTFFKNILKPKRERAIDATEHDGINITSYERIESGREPQTKEQKEKEKAAFITRAIRAFGEAKKDEIKLTQDVIASRMYPKLEVDAAKAKFIRLLIKHNIKWGTIKKSYGKLI